MTVVQQRTVPQSLLAATTLTPPDYLDCFTATAPGAGERSAERWARAAMEGANPRARFMAWQVVLGLRLEPAAPERVAGWRITNCEERRIRVEASSWFLTAQCVFEVHEAHVALATFIRYDRAVAALLWPPASIAHRRAVPGMLGGAVRRMAVAKRPA